jgi:leucyl-tRNA synthetase
VFGLPVVRTVAAPDDHPDDQAYSGDGTVINSANDEISLNGLGVTEATTVITEWLQRRGSGATGDPVPAARLVVLPTALLG